MIKYKKNSFINQPQSKILVSVILLVVLISVVNAFEFDNTLSYDSNTKTATITNALGLGEKIADVKLTSNLKEYVIKGNDRKVAEFVISNYQKDYVDALKTINLYNLNLGNSKINRAITYKYRTIIGYYDIPIYESDCSTEPCKHTLISTSKKPIYDWVEFKELSELPAGEQTIGIFTNVYEGDNVEWIPTFFGVEINQWATWTASYNTNLTAYYDFQETSGDLVDRTGNAHNNFTAVPTQVTRGVTGINNNAYNYTGSGSADTITLNDTMGDFNISTSSNMTISLWVNFEASFTGGSILQKESSYRFYANPSYDFEFSFWQSDATALSSYPNKQLTGGRWYNFVVRFNSTDVSYFINGTEMAHTSYDGTIRNVGVLKLFGSGGTYMLDEVSIWKRPLSDSEIANLWDSGTGTFYTAGSGTPDVTIDVTLTSPATAYTTTASNIRLNASFTATNGNLTNTTLYVYNSTGVFNTTFRSLSGTDNSSSILINNLVADNYKWNYLTCGVNLSGTNTSCLFASANRTFDVLSATLNTETFKYYTIEGSLDYFAVNITTINHLVVTSAKLIYNNTAYTGTITSIGNDEYILYKNLTIPSVSATLNNTFYWNIIFSSGGAYNTTQHNQSVANFGVDGCSSFTSQLFNLTMYDEDSQTMLSEGPENTSIKITLDFYNSDGSIKVANLSLNFSYINPARVCMQSNLSTEKYLIDGIIEYSSLGRFTEYYNIQHYNLTSSTTNSSINLYDLNSSKGQTFKITYKDSNFVPVNDAVLFIQRKYVEQGVYKTIEVPKTSQGYTIAHLIRNDIIYNIIVMKNGVVIATFPDIIAECQNPLLSSCEINLNSYSSSNMPVDFKYYKDLTFTLTYNKDTRTISSTYVIPSGLVSTINLNATLFDTLGNRSVCSDSLTASSGTLNCVVPLSFGNSSVIASIYKGGEFVGQSIIKMYQDPKSIYGSNIILIAILIFSIFIGIAISSDSPMFSGIILVIGTIVLIALNIVYSPAIIGTGATILWFVVAVVLILIKGATR